jgi:hypothetical protein
MVMASAPRHQTSSVRTPCCRMLPSGIGFRCSRRTEISGQERCRGQACARDFLSRSESLKVSAKCGIWGGIDSPPWLWNNHLTTEGERGHDERVRPI